LAALRLHLAWDLREARPLAALGEMGQNDHFLRGPPVIEPDEPQGAAMIAEGEIDPIVVALPPDPRRAGGSPRCPGGAAPALAGVFREVYDAIAGDVGGRGSGQSDELSPPFRRQSGQPCDPRLGRTGGREETGAGEHSVLALRGGKGRRLADAGYGHRAPVPPLLADQAEGPGLLLADRRARAVQEEPGRAGLVVGGIRRRGGRSGYGFAERLPGAFLPAHRLDARRSARPGRDHGAWTHGAGEASLGIIRPCPRLPAVAVQLDEPGALAADRRQREERASRRGVHADQGENGRAVADRRRGRRCGGCQEAEREDYRSAVHRRFSALITELRARREPPRRARPR